MRAPTTEFCVSLTNNLSNFITEDEFAMRGIDYWCERALMELIIGKSFSSAIRDAKD